MNTDNLHILLVEDDDVDAMNVRRAFKKINVLNPLHHVRNGREALDVLRGTHGEKLTPPPKIILLDINMPCMNGIDFLKELRADPELKSISVFVLTTSDEERDKVAAYDFNVAGYILKPVEWDKFVDAVSRLKLYWTLIEMPV